VQLIIHPGHVVLTIEDDGRGFNLNELGKNGTRVGLGLRNLCHRTTEVGGKIDIDTSKGNGTVVMIRIPREGNRV
jgi:signal transduction histidine kinase